MNFIQMSLAGAIMVLAVAIIRLCFMHRIPQKTFVVLWGLVLCRLLLPFDITAPTSIFAIGQRMQGTAEPVITFETIDSAVMEEGLTNIYTWQYVQARIDQQFPAVEQVEPGLSIVSLLTIFWLVGLVLFGIFFTTLYIKQRRKFLMSLPLENEFIANWQQKHKLKRQIHVRVSDQITTPLTYGIHAPVILLPKNMNWSDEKGLAHILAHEWIHIKRFDALKKLLLAAVLCVHWFNPLVWLMYILFNRDLELACDEGVIRLFGEEEKPEYARTLIGAQEQKSYPPLYNTFGKYAIEERIQAIMQSRKASLVRVFAAFLLVASIAMVLATSAVAGMNYDMSARIIVMTEATPSKEEISAEEAATIGRLAFSRYFPAFARDWETWDDITFVMGFSETEDTKNPHDWDTFPIWHGMMIVDTDSGLGHDFPLVFSVHGETGEILDISYAPRTNYALALQAARAEGEGRVQSAFQAWEEAHPGLRQGKYNDMFVALAEQTVRDIEFFASEIVSIRAYRAGMMTSGPMCIVLVEYANGALVELEFLLVERELIAVKYIRPPLT